MKTLRTACVTNQHKAENKTHMFPRYSLSLIFLLLLFQHQLNEELLQFLIAVVYTELLKAGQNKKDTK